MPKTTMLTQNSSNKDYFVRRTRRARLQQPILKAPSNFVRFVVENCTFFMSAQPRKSLINTPKLWVTRAIGANGSTISTMGRLVKLINSKPGTLLKTCTPQRRKHIGKISQKMTLGLIQPNPIDQI